MKVIIYGNGAMARILHSYARHQLTVCGFTVDAGCIEGDSETFCGLPLVPFHHVETVFSPQECRIIVAVGFIEMNELRERKSLEAKAKGYALGRYIHPSVMLHDGVSFGDGCVVLDHVSVHPGCSIGEGTFIASNVNIGHDCDIGPFNWINGGVMIAGGCRVGRGCFFGVNSSLGHGVRVGERNFVAANTLVNRDTRDDEVFLSGPGQRFRLGSKSFLKFSRILE